MAEQAVEWGRVGARIRSAHYIQPPQPPGGRIRRPSKTKTSPVHRVPPPSPQGGSSSPLPPPPRAQKWIPAPRLLPHPPPPLPRSTPLTGGLRFMGKQLPPLVVGLHAFSPYGQNLEGGNRGRGRGSVGQSWHTLTKLRRRLIGDPCNTTSRHTHLLELSIASLSRTLCDSTTTLACSSPCRPPPSCVPLPAAAAAANSLTRP